MFTIIAQNSATRQEFVIEHLVNSSPSPLYYQFRRFTMPAGAPKGEYRCALIWNGRDDCVYVTSDDLMETLIKTEEGDVYLKDLRPEVFLLRYGDLEDTGLKINRDTNYVYRRK